MIGLSAGIACTLLIYLWVHDELSYDRIFEKDSQIYQVMEHRKDGDNQQLTDESSGLVSENIKLLAPEIEYAAAVAPPDWFQKFTLTSGEKNIKAAGQYTGKDYFNIFSFKMIRGKKEVYLLPKTLLLFLMSLPKSCLILQM